MVLVRAKVQISQKDAKGLCAYRRRTYKTPSGLDSQKKKRWSDMLVATRSVRPPGRLGFSGVFEQLVLVLAVAFGSAAAHAQAAPLNNGFGSDASRAETNAPGIRDETQPTNKITMDNWQLYHEYMPDGMVMLFEGKYFWKMPNDVQIDIGPTVIHALPKNYLDATEKYSGQVKLVDLPDGALTLSGYQGGLPFPDPAEPHAGWKILANLWFRYLPHLSVDTNGVVCTMDSGNRVSCKTGMKIYRQLAYNTDPGVPPIIAGAEGKYFTQYESVKEPEQERYTTVLTISYADLTRPEDLYVFLPALRRSQRMSASARCSPDLGTDETPDDRRYGFNMNLTRIEAELLGEKRILALMDISIPPGRFPDNYDMPLGWPKPSWGKWQIRSVYIVNVTKLGGGSGHCLGRRVVYVDKATYAPLWEDLYDETMKPWRLVGFFLRTLDIPGIGVVDTSNSMVYAFWDVKYSHATIFAEPGEGEPFYLDEQAPRDFFDLEKYTTPEGLSLIMR